MIIGMTIERLQHRCDRLFRDADALKLMLDTEESIQNFMDHKFVRARRQMISKYAEASTISICLETFRDACYYPLGPLV